MNLTDFIRDEITGLTREQYYAFDKTYNVPLIVNGDPVGLQLMPRLGTLIKISKGFYHIKWDALEEPERHPIGSYVLSSSLQLRQETDTKEVDNRNHQNVNPLDGIAEYDTPRQGSKATDQAVLDELMTDARFVQSWQPPGNADVNKFIAAAKRIAAAAIIGCTLTIAEEEAAAAGRPPIMPR